MKRRSDSWLKYLAIFALIVLTSAPAALAQEAPPEEPAAASEEPTAEEPAPGPALEPGPVAVPEPSERAMRHYRENHTLWWLGQLMDMLSPWIILITGFSALLAGWARKIGRHWAIAAGIYMVLYGIADFVLFMPYDGYSFFRERAWGLTDQSYGAFLWENFVFLQEVVVTFFIPFIILMYLWIRKFPKIWWLLTAVTFIFLATVEEGVRARWVSPPELQPIEDPAFAAELRGLAERAGFPDIDIYRAGEGAGVSAAGVTEPRRLFVEAPSPEGYSEEQLLFLAAHQLGRYHRHSGLKIHLEWLLNSCVVFFLIHLAAGPIIRRFKHRFKFDELRDLASYPLIFMLWVFFLLLVIPFSHLLAKHETHEADRFALELVRDNRAAAEAVLTAEGGELVNPRPGTIRQIWSRSPRLAERVEFLNEYRPWESGEALEYGDVFEGGE